MVKKNRIGLKGFKILLCIFFSGSISAQDSGGRWLIDLSAATGEANNRTYSEANLGVNYYFSEWLAWRNAGFYRFVSEADDFYGLDSSARLRLRVPLGLKSGFTLFGGGGYRFPNIGRAAPLAEGGLILRVAGVSLGGGVRKIFTSVVDDRVEEDELLYFIVLSGSARL